MHNSGAQQNGSEVQFFATPSNTKAEVNHANELKGFACIK